MDIGRVHFAPESFPLLESLAGLRALSLSPDPRRWSRWQAWAATRLPRPARPLLELVSSCGEATMFAAVPEADLDRALTTVRGIPAPVVRKRLDANPGGRGIPSWLLEFAGADGEGRQQLCSALHACFTTCFLPYWRHAQAAHARESARFSGTVLRAGVRSAVEDLLPGADALHGTLHGTLHDCLHDGPSGGAVMLVPSLFWTGAPWICTLSDGRAALVYAPEASSAVFHQRLPDRPDVLRQLLGRTRAAVLCSLAQPCGTVELASRVHMSPATTSEHAGVLRAAGLILTARCGRSVRHSLTDLGRQLVRGA